MYPFRPVIRSDTYDESGALIAGDLKRWDEITAGIEYLLSRPGGAELYPIVDGAGDLRVASTYLLDGESSYVLVFFRIEDDTVVLEDVERITDI